MNESLLSSQATEQPEAAASDTVSPQITDAVTQAQPASGDLLLGKYKTTDDLAKAYKELESKLGAKDDDLRARILEELNEEAYKDRPASAGDYKLPESVDESQAIDNELLKWWSEHSYENGYSQEEFEKGIEIYAKSMMADQPNLEVESKRLGENASGRIQAASMFATKFFPSSVMPAIERMCETADGIMALEVIMEAMKDGSFSGASEPAGRITEQGLREMMQDERYHNPAKRDLHFVRQVEQGFKALYG
jgi:hypothetical protein